MPTQHERALYRSHLAGARRLAWMLMGAIAGWLALLWLSFSPWAASAQAACPANTACLSWAHDGKNTDGTAAALTGFRVYYGTGGALLSTLNVSGAATRTANVTGLSPGSYGFQVVAVAGTVLSDPSSTVTKVIPAPKPTAPTNLVAAADLTAWGIVQSDDRVALVAVGTVAAGTMCDATQPVLDKFVVPRAAVTFVGTVRPRVIVSACG